MGKLRRQPQVFIHAHSSLAKYKVKSYLFKIALDLLQKQYAFSNGFHRSLFVFYHLGCTGESEIARSTPYVPFDFTIQPTARKSTIVPSRLHMRWDPKHAKILAWSITPAVKLFLCISRPIESLWGEMRCSSLVQNAEKRVTFVVFIVFIVSTPGY